MKKRVEKRSRSRAILLTIAAFVVVFFFILPLTLTFFDGATGNVALIPVYGVITGGGSSLLGTPTVSSQTIINFLKQADEHPSVAVIVLEINSPGGSAVASDEIATAIKQTKKPVVALIREVGASGGYWIASASDYIIANRMSITGSIGVISSYLEFSGLMDKYGVSYERLVAGNHKDMLTPYKELQDGERQIIQKKIDTIHDFFIQEVAVNRQLTTEEVKSLATGEFYLGTEAFSLGLVDQLGDKTTLERYLKETYGLKDIQYREYQRNVGFLERFAGVFSGLFFNLGEGIGSLLVRGGNGLPLV